MTLPGEEAARSLARRAAADVDPNIVSLASLLAAAAAGAAFYLGATVPGALLVAFSGFLDLVDGEIARAHGHSSRLGDFLDHTFDRVADVAIFTGIALGPTVPLPTGLAAALATVMVAYLGTQAQAVGLQRVYGGIARRSNVMPLVFVAGTITPLFHDSLLQATRLIVTLSVVTFLQRFVSIYRGLR